ncbi:MAG TPA: efflux transporter outer membrane subunit [Caulobacteraceae bacterium]|jgi:NodT family efflux transporter outer membrane factor (OMF) lipoprotein
MLRRRLTLLLVSAIAFTLAACSFAPKYLPPLVAVPQTYQQQGVWGPAQPSDSLARGDWWARFSDPMLNALESQIEPANQDLAAAVARHDQARDFAAEASAGLYPQIGLGGAAEANRQSLQRPLRGASQPTYYSAEQVGAAVSYEFDFWGKIRNEIASRKALAQASNADLATMRLSLQTELASAYFQLRGLDADTKLLADTVDAYQKAHDLTETLYKGKIAASIDVSRAATQLDTARAQVSDIAARRALLEHAIAVLVGKPASDFTVAPQVVPFVLPEIPTDLPSTLLQRRPDIASAERAAAAANAEIGVARAAFYPTVTFGALGGFQSSGQNLFNLADSFWTLGPSVNLPLLDGGRLRAQEAGAYARFRETSAAYRSTVLTAFKEVEDNRAVLHWLGQESADTDAGVTAAQHTLDVALALYREGATSYLEVVTAQTALLQTQQSALDLRTRRLIADVGLVRALGGGWDATELAATPGKAPFPG